MDADKADYNEFVMNWAHIILVIWEFWLFLCINNVQEDKSQQVLTQMGLCFNKSFHFKNCPDIKKQQCQSEYPVKYPSWDNS